MFVGSGVYAYGGRINGEVFSPEYEVCLDCGRMRIGHEPCDYDIDFMKYRLFEQRQFEFVDFEHFFFKRHRYLSENRI